MIYSTENPPSLDRLVDSNGDWMVAFVYSNWGTDNVLMLLPRLDPSPDSLESMINADVMNIPAGSQEEDYMIEQWTKKHPDSPFLVRTGDVVKGVSEMNRRLALYGGDWHRFVEDSCEFDKWRRVAFYVANGPDNIDYVVWHEGWEYVFEQAEAFIAQLR